MLIEVTAEDIATGVRGCQLGCPVARALTRAMGCAWQVNHWKAEAAAGGWPRFTLRLDVKMWLWRFDRGEPVEPFRFDAPVEPQPRFYLVNKTCGQHGELIADEVVGFGERKIKNVRPRKE